jgi:hypothetical protein
MAGVGTVGAKQELNRLQQKVSASRFALYLSHDRIKNTLSDAFIFLFNRSPGTENDQ